MITFSKEKGARSRPRFVCYYSEYIREPDEKMNHGCETDVSIAAADIVELLKPLLCVLSRQKSTLQACEKVNLAANAKSSLTRSGYI